jgi:hypothetical protein
MSTEITVQSEEPSALSFASKSTFEHIQRVAQLFAASQLVPTAFQGNLPDCVIALDMAARMNASPFAIIQNLAIIHGKPSFSSQFLIAAVNTCGRFLPIRFHVEGEGDQKSCIAWTIEKASAKEFASLLGKLVTLPAARSQSAVPFLEGPPVSIEMAKAEGWATKSGSKWKTMPDLMLRYRAAAFFARLYAPELTMGIRPTEEVIDVEGAEVRDVTPPATAPAADYIASVASQSAPVAPAAPRVRKGVSKAAQAAEIVVEASPQPTVVEVAAVTAAAVAASIGTAPTAPAPAAALPQMRCEIERMVKRPDVAGKPASCEVTLTGGWVGTAFFVGTLDQLPDVGQIADITLEQRWNADRTRSAHFIISAVPATA